MPAIDYLRIEFHRFSDIRIRVLLNGVPARRSYLTILGINAGIVPGYPTRRDGYGGMIAPPSTPRLRISLLDHNPIFVQPGEVAILSVRDGRVFGLQGIYPDHTIPAHSIGTMLELREIEDENMIRACKQEDNLRSNT